MRKGRNLAWQTSSKDSITMNLGKSAASFSDSERFHLDFVLRRDIRCIFSLTLCSSTHHEVQLVIGMNQRGSPFTPVETGIDEQYIRVEGRLTSRCQFQVLSTGQIPILTAIFPSATAFKHLTDKGWKLLQAQI